MHAQFFAPARVDLVGVLGEGNEGAGEFRMFLGPFDRIGLGLPALVGLAQAGGTGSGAVDVAVGAAAGGVDDVAVAEILEEAGQTQGVHAARDDRRRRLHAVPLLVVGRAGVAVALDDVGDGAVVLVAFHLAVAHGADVDAGSALQARHLGQHVGGVAALGRGRGDGAVAGAVVVQVLVGEAAAGGGDHARTADIAVDQEGHLVGIRPEGFEDVFAAGDHFVMIVGGDVGRVLIVL